MIRLRDRLLSSTTLRLIKLPIQRSLRQIGYELVPISIVHSEFLNRLIVRHSIDLLVDVGANQGQFAQKFRDSGFEGAMCSFEPLSSAFHLLKRAAASDARWTVVRTALGEMSGEAELNVSANAVSSSLLTITETHLRAEGTSGTTRREPVPVTTLDFQLAKTPGEALWLKLDVQGYEHQVLLGASKTLRRTAVIQCEISFRELYIGQATYINLLNFLDDLGFVPVSVVPGFTDPLTGEALQCDLLLVRKGKN